jgi:hypothetical protein
MMVIARPCAAAQPARLTRLVAVVVRCAKRWRWDGSAAQHDPGAHPAVVGLPDSHGVHARPHERNSAATVFSIRRGRAPTPMVAHDDRDPTLPARRFLDSTVHLYHVTS